MTFVASQMRVSTATARNYLTDEAIKGLAQTLAFSFVEETPGADLLAAPRDAAIPVRLAGRVCAGLAEAVRIRLAEREDLQHTREGVAQLTHAQAALGLIISDQIAEDIDGEPWVWVPRALLHRRARYLEPRPTWSTRAWSATTWNPLKPEAFQKRYAVTLGSSAHSPTQTDGVAALQSARTVGIGNRVGGHGRADMLPGLIARRPLKRRCRERQGSCKGNSAA